MIQENANYIVARKVIALILTQYSIQVGLITVVSEDLYLLVVVPTRCCGVEAEETDINSLGLAAFALADSKWRHLSEWAQTKVADRRAANAICMQSMSSSG